MFITEAPAATVKILITKKYRNKARYNITVTRELILKKKRFQGFLENGQRLV